MKLDFTVINKIDGMSIYANKILENIYSSFKNDLFLFHSSYKSKILNEISYKKISNVLLHRLSLGLFDKTFYYSPTHHGPIFNKNKILTVHDITPLLLKDKSYKQYIYYKYFLGLSIKNTKKIITVSTFTKNKLIEVYRLDYKKDDIIVIHNATDIDEVKEEVVDNLPKKYLFFPGVHSEYKNYKRVIEALENIRAKELFLIITSNNEDVKEYCKEKENILVISNLSYGQVKHLYLNSIALVYPSLIEGFGFPALESARLNKPIITTKDSSMEEFLGKEAAIYVNPYDVADIKNAIEKSLNDDLSSIINTAYENTKHLIWRKNAQSVMEIIKVNRE